ERQPDRRGAGRHAAVATPVQPPRSGDPSGGDADRTASAHPGRPSRPRRLDLRDDRHAGGSGAQAGAGDGTLTLDRKPVEEPPTGLVQRTDLTRWLTIISHSYHNFWVRVISLALKRLQEQPKQTPRLGGKV